MDIDAVFFIDRIERVQNRNTLQLVMSRHLADQHRRIDSVLIPHISTGKIPITFLKAEDVAAFLAFFLQIMDLFADEFKSGQDVDHPDAIVCGNLSGQLSGNDGLDGNRVFRHFAGSGTLFADIFNQQSAYLVAGNQHITAFFVRYGNPYAVAVGVGSQQQIRFFFLAERQAQPHSLFNFRVREGAGAEGTVWIFLLGDDHDVLNAYPFQDLANRDVPGAVQGGINHLQAGFLAGFGIQGFALYMVEELLLYLGFDILHTAFLQGFFKGQRFYSLENINLID